MVQYLHFRILKLPLIWPIVDLPSYKIVNFHRFLYVYQRLCCITQMFYGEKNHWLIDSNNINHNYNVGPPSYKLVYKPSNYIVISTINHSYWSYKPTYIAILGASHCIYIYPTDPLVISQLAIENGHLVPWFTHEIHGDIMICSIVCCVFTRG